MKERCILEKNPSGYFLIEFSNEEERDKAFKMMNKDQEVLFGSSEDITYEKYYDLKEEGYLWIEVGL